MVMLSEEELSNVSNGDTGGVKDGGGVSVIAFLAVREALLSFAMAWAVIDGWD